MSRDDNPIAAAYRGVANRLCDRIRRLIPDHPEILAMERAEELWHLDRFHCDDLAPSLNQAAAALRQAQRLGPLS